MHLFDEIRKVVATVAGRIAATRRGSEFTCGDCERNERCGLPPHDNCVAKAAQIARDGEYNQRQPASLYKGVWPR